MDTFSLLISIFMIAQTALYWIGKGEFKKLQKKVKDLEKRLENKA